ncbi:tumor necrosis factor ligand superfamily member 6 [Gouania willdenowi]|uniref:THD domain-containing protein n=1 Tax=Gouania willdenowi TaxID=441366 RepID=A0A8C5D9E5_GOUWI|nr:tumor necrosis factor ligand superfamily member 6 [Gouania willdenowi]
MSFPQNFPLPPVFMVDGRTAPQHPAEAPALIPCWSFPPAQQRVMHRRRRKCWGIGHGAAVVVLLLFLLVFAALGFEAYQIFNIQKTLKEIKQVKPMTEFETPQKQIGPWEAETNQNTRQDRPAAHVIGLNHNPQNVLRWESKAGQGFTSGGVTYQAEDGALQVNQTGLYHIYSRVEVLLRGCSSSSSTVHSVFLRRKGYALPVTLMEAFKASVCSPQRPSQSWTTESYLSSIHQLRKHDRVYVNVSNPAALHLSHNANFFGLYMI